jgi:hypothetical protein
MPLGWPRVLLPVAVCAAVLMPASATYADEPEGVPIAAPAAPAAPTGLVVTPGAGRLDLVWTAPADDGGTPVGDYEVTATAPDEPVAAVLAQGTAAAVEGLKNGVTYDVRVVAHNAAGSSEAATGLGTPRTTPPAPVITKVVPGDAAATVTWASKGDGGAPVLEYVVRSSPGNGLARVTGGTTTATVHGLLNGYLTTFTVTAVNVAGAGAPSAPSGGVVPRLAAKLGVVTQPAAAVTYGTTTSVRASLTGPGGVGLPGGLVELWAKVYPKTTYARVDAGTTDGTGRITLTTTLRANASLLLRHPPGTFAAADVPVRAVTVAPRLGAAPSATTVLVNDRLTVRGSVAPAQPVGAAVRLQRRSSTGWLTVASGTMTTSSAYRVSWRPERVGTYALRVIRPAGTGRALGKSAAWSQRVRAENATDIARDIAADGGIALDSVHVSGRVDLAHAKQNIVDVAAGRLARRSSYENAPGGYTTLDRRLLRALRRMGARGRVTVSEIAGGSHSRGSTHYYGRGLDIRSVNGVPVRRGTSYRLAVEACRVYGASRVFHPAYDPYGGHQGHVHCDWT